MKRCIYLVIFAILVGATAVQAAPNAPTLLSVEGKTAVPGTPLYLNITTGITLSGNAEANKTIRAYRGSTLLGSTTSNASGVYNLDVALAAGTYSLTVVASDATGDSAPSATITVTIDTTLPTATFQWLDSSGHNATGRIYIHTNTNVSDHRFSDASTSMEAQFADTGGSGFDLTTAQLVLQEVDNSNNVLATIPSATTVIAANKVRLDLTSTSPANNFAAVFSHGKKYRLRAIIRDFAGNQRTEDKLFGVDNLRHLDYPGATYFNKVYLFDAADTTITNPPPLNKMVPMLWDGTRYVVGSVAGVDPALVDTSTTPPSLRFNLLGAYGSLFQGGAANPPLATGVDTLPQQFTNLGVFSWYTGTGSSAIGALSAPDSLGNRYTFFSKDTAMHPNGTHNSRFLTVDSAVNREYRNYRIQINANDPVPSIPTLDSFHRATNPAIVYTNQGVMVGGERPSLRVSNSDDVLVRGRVQAIGVPQIVEVVNQTNTNIVYGRVRVPAGQATYELRIGTTPSDVSGETPTLTPLPAKARTQFRTQSRTATQTTTDGTGWWIYWQDDLPPRVQVVDPAAGNYYRGVTNPLGSPNFPLSYGVDVYEPTYLTPSSLTPAPLGEAASRMDMLNNASVVLTATRSSWSQVNGINYYRQTLTLGSRPTTEGRYLLQGTLSDNTQNVPNSIVTSHLALDPASPLAYYVDNTAPVSQNIIPAEGVVTSIPSFNADIVDPDLGNAPANTRGSGAQLDLGQNQIDAYKFLGFGTASSTSALTVTINTPKSGQAADHRGNVFPVGAELQVWENSPSNSIVGVVTLGNSLTQNSTITNNGTTTAGQLRLTMKSGYQSLVNGQTYRVFYTIPHFDSNDGVRKVAAIPIEPAIYPGSYASRITAQDRVGNINTTVSTVNIQMNDPPSGTISFNPASYQVHILSAAPNERVTVTSEPIRTLSGATVPAGTLITVSATSPGVIVTPDANGVAADGHQIAATADGRISLVIRALDSTTRGTSNLTASAGTATGSTTVAMIRPLLTLAKSADVTRLSPGQVITYTLVYNNLGNSEARNVVISDQVPAGGEYVIQSVRLNGVLQNDAAVFQSLNNRIQVTVTSVPQDATGTLTFQVRVK